MTDRIRVAVADDHNLFRAGLVEVLQTYADIEVVAEAATAAEALEIARTECPDVMLLDLDMPDTKSSGENGAGTAYGVMTLSPTTKVIVVTMHDDVDMVRRLIDAGVSGYLLKSAGREELNAAIRAAVRGEDAVVVSVSRGTASALSARTSQAPAGLLTARELDVLQCLADGDTNRSIAGKLHMAEGTIKRHIATVYTKLDAHTRTEAVRKARAAGLLRQ